MHLELRRHGGVHGVEEVAELLGPVPPVAAADHLARRHVQGGEQGGGAVPDVVRGAPLRLARAHRQHGLGPLDRLHLGLLVHAQHQGPVGRVRGTARRCPAPSRRTRGRRRAVKPSVRCGLRPKARQTRCTVAGERPQAAAIERVLQWVAFSGVASSVRTSSSATRSSVTVRGAPLRGSSRSPSSRSLAKRSRHLPTVCLATPSSAAIAVLLSPSAARSTMRARRASAWAVLRRRAHPSSSACSASLKASVAGTRYGIIASLPDPPFCTRLQRHATRGGPKQPAGEAPWTLSASTSRRPSST